MDSPNAAERSCDIDSLWERRNIYLAKSAVLLAFLALMLITLAALNITTPIILFAQSGDKEDGDNSSKQGTDEGKNVYKLRVGYKSYPIKYSIKGGELVNMTIPRSDILEIFVKPNSSGSITVEIPKSMSLLKGNIFDFKALRTMKLDFDANTTSVKMRGLTKVTNVDNLRDNENHTVGLPIAAKENNTILNSNSNLMTNVSISDLPDTIELVDPGWGNYNLTLRAMINNGNITYQDNYKSGSAEVLDWTPLMVFQVPNVKSGFGLTDVGHVSIVSIKLYKDKQDMLKNLHIWKNIPLNEEVVFRLPNRGLNLIVAEIQFSNGIKGLYGGALNVSVHESKSEGIKTFNEERSQDKKLVTKEIKFPKSSLKPEDQEFLLAAENITCTVHKTKGFEFCQ